MAARRARGVSRRAGVLTGLGLAAASCTWAVLAVAGLGLLIAHAGWVYTVVQFAGAAYLIWLGIRALRTPGVMTTTGQLERATEWALFRQGVTTNVLNPKVALFFLAFLPQFADPMRGSVALQIIVLGCLFNLSGTLVNIGVAWLAGSVRQWLAPGNRGERVFRWMTGSVFIGMGLRLAFAQRR